MIPVALTVAGSDPSGGAGLQADLKTFYNRGVYGMAVVSLLTVQNTRSVSSVLVLKGEQVAAQLDAVLEDIPPHAAKFGALGNKEVIEHLSIRAKHFKFPLVIDPVMLSKHGEVLMASDAHEVIKKKLFPYATLVTPNLQEAQDLSGITVANLDDMKRAAQKIAECGSKAVLIKGGHLSGEATDLLWYEGKAELFKSERLPNKHTHGTGCTSSAVITAELAKGKPLPEAVRIAKDFITKAIDTGPNLGGGIGPVNHFVSLD